MDKIFEQLWGLEAKPNFEEFKNRIINVLNSTNIRNNFIGPKEIEDVCQLLGMPFYYRVNWGAIVLALKEESDEIQFLRKVSKIISYLRFDGFILGVQQAIELSNLPYALKHIKGCFLIIPIGEAKLDKELVCPIFSFLNDKSSSHIERSFANVLDKKYIEAAEALRRGLEDFLRYKLNNDRGLDGNIKELGKVLKIEKNDSSIRAIVQTNFSHLDKWFNDNSKHKTADLNKEDIQFMIYQVSALMYFINNVISQD